MSKKTILIAFATTRDIRELDIFRDKYHLIFHKWDKSIFDELLIKENLSHSFCSEEKLNELIMLANTHAIDGIACTDDYPGPLFVSAVTHHLGLKGPSLSSIINCQHKYYSRLSQKQYVPFATPDFKLINHEAVKNDFDLPFPVFIKPAKSYLSRLAQKVNSLEELGELINSNIPSESFLSYLNWFIKNYSNYEFNANYLLAESLLTGSQITLDGYVFNGQVNIFGIVDTITFPNIISAKQFDYPSSLSIDVQNRMFDIAKKIMNGISYDNFLFNIEFMYDHLTDKICIIEINSRMTSQFADLYEKVNGINPYEILIDIALGNEPKVNERKGKYNFASSFVLRSFENKKVVKIPTRSEISIFSQKFPDARLEILIHEGQWLNEILQDETSYRYGLINLGAQTKDELNACFEESKQLLTFQFS